MHFNFLKLFEYSISLISFLKRLKITVKAKLYKGFSKSEKLWKWSRADPMIPLIIRFYNT